MDIYEQLIRMEDNRLKPYCDACGRYFRDCTCQPFLKGNLTIGVGRNLEDMGINASESHLLFQNDVEAARREVNLAYPWAAGLLSDARYGVLLNMRFAMGIGRLMGFKKMIAAIRVEDWQRAHDQIVDSDFWRGPHRNRAERLAEQLLTGQWK